MEFNKSVILAGKTKNTNLGEHTHLIENFTSAFESRSYGCYANNKMLLTPEKSRK